MGKNEVTLVVGKLCLILIPSALVVKALVSAFIDFFDKFLPENCTEMKKWILEFSSQSDQTINELHPGKKPLFLIGLIKFLNTPGHLCNSQRIDVPHWSISININICLTLKGTP